eukprot:2194028-Prymnesium_polylepis.1
MFTVLLDLHGYIGASANNAASCPQDEFVDTIGNSGVNADCGDYVSGAFTIIVCTAGMGTEASAEWYCPSSDGSRDNGGNDDDVSCPDGQAIIAMCSSGNQAHCSPSSSCTSQWTTIQCATPSGAAVGSGAWQTAVGSHGSPCQLTQCPAGYIACGACSSGKSPGCSGWLHEDQVLPVGYTRI